MKNANLKNNDSGERGGFNPYNKMNNNSKIKMKKNMQRLGGTGLSLEAFANAKSKQNSYNPALLKKNREFYTNAKHVSKYKKLLKQQNQPNDQSISVEPVEENDGGPGETSKEDKKNKKGSYSLQELYVKKHEEQEKARMEREAFYKAKKEEKEKAESRRKDLREKMFKRTRKGQPVMKYRIEHILETLQGSTSTS
ncbi:rRNA-processing protein FYV7-like [Chenopodium quinoa]|uniref:rRNA-processing protein FYV7 n=1 Tax=Chenopodium quinoa TaxID=63459 RepID=A0A803MWR5_CHEQI|nr:rRNA-processing protein FYV7-like [Chenopodium quinoa]